MGAAGLEIVKIWEDENRESIIEVQGLGERKKLATRKSYGDERVFF